MLRDLFEGTGVMGALDHAKIESANDPESLSVEAQAAKTAKRAADALRRSQAQVQVNPSLARLCPPDSIGRLCPVFCLGVGAHTPSGSP